jgi:hypothetical protein
MSAGSCLSPADLRHDLAIFNSSACEFLSSRRDWCIDIISVRYWGAIPFMARNISSTLNWIRYLGQLSAVPPILRRSVIRCIRIGWSTVSKAADISKSTRKVTAFMVQGYHIGLQIAITVPCVSTQTYFWDALARRHTWFMSRQLVGPD